MARRRSVDIEADAEEALVHALEEALEGSIDVVRIHEGGPDLTVSIPGSAPIAVEVKGVAARAEPGPIATALPNWDAQLEALRDKSASHVIGVVVASAVPDTTKAILRKHGWGW